MLGFGLSMFYLWKYFNLETCFVDCKCGFYIISHHFKIWVWALYANKISSYFCCITTYSSGFTSAAQLSQSSRLIRTASKWFAKCLLVYTVPAIYKQEPPAHSMHSTLTCVTWVGARWGLRFGRWEIPQTCGSAWLKPNCQAQQLC